MRLHQLVFLGAIPAFFFPGCHRQTFVDPRLQAPDDLLREVSGRHLTRLFVNPAAPDEVKKSGRIPLAADPDDLVAVRDPAAWRRLDRIHRYDGVLLIGSTAEFAPLLSHLATAPDFRLVRVDNWGALFARASHAPFEAPDYRALEKTFTLAADRSAYFASMAVLLDAAGLPAEADECVGVAVDCAPENAPGWIAKAAVALRRRQYPLSIQNAEKALRLEKNSLPALEIEVQALVALHATDAAWRVAKILKSAAPPDDRNVLFLHARVANAAHAYEDEQRSLEALVSLAKARGTPATDYRIYLGQCYARQGLARPALEQFDLASKDSGLTADQRADIATALQSVRSRAGKLSD